jgi:hypothetical protein
MQLGRRAVVDGNGGLGRDTQPVVHCVSYQTAYCRLHLPNRKVQTARKSLEDGSGFLGRGVREQAIVW